VSSVKSGSPADGTGVQGGDIITTMEGLVLATDGTMADYCDILRSHSASDTLSIEVLRFSTSEVLEGQLNGRPLELSFTFANELGDQVAGTGTEGGYSQYQTISDDLGAIQMDVPTEWSDIDGRPWEHDSGAEFASVFAAPSIDDFLGTWGTPGAKFDVTNDMGLLGGHVQVLDRRRQEATFLDDCELDGRYDYDDTVYRGKFDLFVDCANSGAQYLILAAVPTEDPDAFLILLEIQIVTEADLDAADRILNTFNVVGALP
jgi:serine protease Do